MHVNFLFIGGPEIFIIVLIVVMVFGADKIPEIARGLGKGIRQVKEYPRHKEVYPLRR
jgi:sec-independent protein translocase protein TatA